MANVPSICRLVVYHHPGSADGRFKAVDSPALIQRVNADDSCELVVFSVYGGLFFNHGAIEGSDAGQWSWPERR